MKVFRWRAIGTFAGVVLLLALLSSLFLNTLVRRGIEEAGELVVGAKVELAGKEPVDRIADAGDDEHPEGEIAEVRQNQPDDQRHQ